MRVRVQADAQLRNTSVDDKHMNMSTVAESAQEDTSSTYEPAESLCEPPGKVSSGGYISPAATDGMGSLGELVSSDERASENSFLDD